ncbi:MAG: polysaccharide pyruvyl transferase family protein, partial [Clostridia bacterium]|nr:polysaccharide pyruvyl transferase family protein [Clostridia bacterium]
MKYNIAISGTFNVENYGDLMFPVIFKRAMEKRNLDFELFLFSPERSCKKALDETTDVFAISEIDKIHDEYPLNAVVVGGGALVHYNKILVKFPQETQVVGYDIGESWYYPIEFAVRNNVKLLFNLPQIPFQFSEPLKATARSAFDCCDYISLRDDISKQYLLNLYDNNPPKIDVYPDSVCCISELIPVEELKNYKQNVLSFDEKYAVIQFNPQKPQDDDQYLVQIINTLKEHGLKVVLLPIGYTHNDDFVLEQFNTNNNLDCEIISKKLNIMETAAVLSGCEIYIGSSFHGAITAIAYGKKAISYNYIFPKNKNQEIFKMYGVSDFVVDNAKDALNLLNDLCDGKISFNPKTDEVLSQLNLYFDDLLSMIKDSISPTHNYR